MVMDFKRIPTSFQSNLKWAIKSIVYSTLIIGSGYWTMVFVTPTEQEMKKRLEHYRKMRGEESVKQDKSVFKRQIDAIKANAASDRPIWDVKFPKQIEVEIAKQIATPSKDKDK